MNLIVTIINTRSAGLTWERLTLKGGKKIKLKTAGKGHT